MYKTIVFDGGHVLKALPFFIRGYFVSAVGLGEEIIKRYVRYQGNHG